MLTRTLDRIVTRLFGLALRLLLPVPENPQAPRPARRPTSVFEAEAFDRCAERNLAPTTFRPS
jgi:hypothetical protein